MGFITSLLHYLWSLSWINNIPKLYIIICIMIQIWNMLIIDHLPTTINQELLSTKGIISVSIRTWLSEAYLLNHSLDWLHTWQVHCWGTVSNLVHFEHAAQLIIINLNCEQTGNQLVWSALQWQGTAFGLCGPNVMTTCRICFLWFSVIIKLLFFLFWC